MLFKSYYYIELLRFGPLLQDDHLHYCNLNFKYLAKAHDDNDIPSMFFHSQSGIEFNICLGITHCLSNSEMFDA